ncbi:MAG TPA: hypothetical protein PLP64_00915 [Pseudothermotoga sp.]|nr:hypothetical protein [Pseudothermotoga sp.]HOK82775.1 hypothetical protein [Pseudothermotoga sp.]HPP71172.1 hypothetical protein [Pseudothermotoga sp.]
MALNESILRSSGIKALFRTIGFGIIGFVAFSKPAKDLNLLNLVFSIMIGLFFGGLYKSFLILFLKPFNRDLKEKYGRKVVKKVSENGLVFIFPFAVIVFFSRFFFGISLLTPLLSSALIISAFAAANSLNSLKEKPRVANTIVAFAISSIFVTLWIYYYSFAARLPLYAESAIKLLQMFFTGAFRT